MTNVSNYETIQAKDKPVADNFVYVYSEIEDGGFRKVSKEMLKILLGIATKLSELENDKEFVSKAVSDLENYYLKTETYSKDEIDDKLSLVPRFSVKVVTTLPTENISDTTVYLVPSNEDEENLYTEYINVNGLWEILGAQKIAKFEVTKEDIESALGYEPANNEKVLQIEKDVNNKLSATELSTAIEEALRQAKESGEFDGKDGVDGYTPQKGIDYFDGQDGKNGEDGKDGLDGKTPEKGVDYFTESDKQAFVTDVINALPTWQGGAF